MKRFFGAQWWWKRLLLLCGATCDLEHCHHVVIPCVVQCCVAPSIESTERHLVSKELVFFVSEPQEGLVLYIRRRMGTGIYKLLCLFGWVAGSGLLCGATFTCDLEHCHHVVPCVVQCCVAPSIESTERHLISKVLVFFVSEPQE